MVNQMVWNNLMFRKTRTALSVIAVALEVLLILSTVGMVAGIVNEQAARTRGIGADVVVRAPGASFLTSLSAAPMPVAIGPLLAKQEHVAIVAPVLAQSAGGLSVVFGIDDRFRQLSGGFTLLEGRDIKTGTELLVDDRYSRANKKHPGQTVELWHTNFTIVGVVQSGKGARLFVPLETAQDLNSSKDKASIFYVRLDDPKNTDAVKARFESPDLLENYSILSMDELTSLITTMEGYPIRPFKLVMTGISVSVGFLVIFLAMYTTVLERTREIGILKSLGGSKVYIANLLLREVMMISIVGIVLGLGATFLLRDFVLRALPTMSVDITGKWILRAAIIAVAGSLIGALYPAIRAAKQDPIAALAYE